MRGLQKSKRVSWASDVNLCQVKLFLTEDSPSVVGLGGQDDLQAKASWPSASDENLPPGFEGMPPSCLFKNKISQIPLINWYLPPRFAFDPDWNVVAGEESEQIEIQIQREMRVLEAYYPRPSAIPPNPLLPGIEDCTYNDEQTPLIPITPVEEEDAVADTYADLPNHHNQHSGVGTTNTNTNSISSTSSSGRGIALEPEVISAAYAALSTVMQNKDQKTNLIDPDLLVQILRNPSFIETLSATATQQQQQQQQYPSTSRPPGGVIPLSEPPLPNRNEGMLPAVQNGPRPGPVYYPPMQPQPQQQPPAKDMNYYKSLIQQHGGERKNESMIQQPPHFVGHHQQMDASVSNQQHQQNQQQQHHLGRGRGDPKMKINKPCIYFNSSRGCRHGANCIYQHDVQQQQRQDVQVPTAKRMKLDREITGT